MAAASAQQALAPGHAAEAGRPAAGETPQPEPEAVRPAADGPQAAAAGSGGASHSGSGSVGALAPSQTPEFHLVLSVRPLATGGAPQPAVAASAAAAAEERPREPSVAPASDTDPGFSPNWSPDEPAETDVKELHAKLREMESADDIPEDVQLELGRILFLKKTVCTGGFRLQYVASSEETVKAIRKLLKRRKDYMWANGLTDGAPQSVEGRYLFSNDNRRELMGLWKEEFHGLPDQVRQQQRDSFKPEKKKAAQTPRRRRIAPVGAPTGGPTRRPCKAASTPGSRGTCNSKRVRKPWPSSSSSPAASTRTS